MKVVGEEELGIPLFLTRGELVKKKFVKIPFIVIVLYSFSLCGFCVIKPS